MTPFLATVLGAMSLAVRLAAADAGFSIGWGDHCWSDAGATNDLTWACNSNSYAGVRMTLSIKSPYTRGDFAGVALYMEGDTEAHDQIPDWWRMESDGCRPWESHLAVSADASAIAGGMGDCVDVWQGTSASGGGAIGNYTTTIFGDHSYFTAIYAIWPRLWVDAGVEYFAFQIRFSTAKTVGGECAGCDLPFVWSVESVELGFDNATISTYLTSTYSGGNQRLYWQRSEVVPARNPTWGQIKSLYRH
jgi:hypothetical protein